MEGRKVNLASLVPLPANRPQPITQALVGLHRSRHGFAPTNPALAAYLNFKDALAAFRVLNNGHVTMLKLPGLVGSQAGLLHKEDEVMQLLGFPTEMLILRLRGILPGRLIELLVFCGAEPKPADKSASDSATTPVGV